MFIPFTFHCGETHQWGGSTDGNLFDAAAMYKWVRRVGHGVGLVNHPELLKEFRERKICVEACPISNEELGLNPRICSHVIYPLLSNGVHVTVAGDNSTLFGSTLSHDMYQVQIGQPRMDISVWRQLAEWSLEHSILSDDERASMVQKWQARWKEFLDWTIDAGERYGAEMARLEKMWEEEDGDGK